MLNITNNKRILIFQDRLNEIRKVRGTLHLWRPLGRCHLRTCRRLRSLRREGIKVKGGSRKPADTCPLAVAFPTRDVYATHTHIHIHIRSLKYKTYFSTCVRTHTPPPINTLVFFEKTLLNSQPYNIYASYNFIQR